MQKFKSTYRYFEDGFYASDMKIADQSIKYAEEWNVFCALGREITVTRGSFATENGQKWLFEPFINGLPLTMDG